MARFYQPDLTENIDSPFIRDGNDKLVRRSYWLDMNDRTLVMVTELVTAEKSASPVIGSRYAFAPLRFACQVTAP